MQWRALILGSTKQKKESFKIKTYLLILYDQRRIKKLRWIRIKKAYMNYGVPSEETTWTLWESENNERERERDKKKTDLKK